MNKYILFFLFISIGYPVNCEGFKLNFQNGGSKFNLKDGDVCFTTEGKEGTCTPISKCYEVKDFIKSRGGINTKGTADILRKRICNFAHSETRVCCLSQTIPNNPIIPTHEECGLTNVNRVRGGEDFLHGEHPWLVGVGYMRGRDRKSIKVECGGTLISKRHVLSAAHCFDRTVEKHPEFTHVILGEHSLSEETEREPPIILKIVDRRNPGYNATIRYRDIELLTLEKDVEFSSYIFPACLPFNKYERHFNFLNNMTVAGWGREAFEHFRGTDKPKEATIPLVPLQECKKAYESIPESLLIDETQICLGGNDRDTCIGDSGGPVIFFDKLNSFRYYVIGITAFGVECGNRKYPGVYTYVPEYMNWILDNL